MESLLVDESQNSTRLDLVLSKHEKVRSRCEAQRIIGVGNVTVNGSMERVLSKRLVKSGDQIVFNLLERPTTEIKAVYHPLEIVYEDPFLLVINKPRDMVVHPAFGHWDDTLVNYLLERTTLSGISEKRPGIVHRLDKDTSGLLVAAKQDHTHMGLAEQFAEHSIERKYQCLVHGIPKESGGTINKSLGRHPVHRKKWSVRPNGKRAVTHWELKKKFQYLSLLECRLETGRTHQIRVHLSSIGHPVLGDGVYGSLKNKNKKFSQTIIQTINELKGHALHAYLLEFTHPDTKKRMKFENKLPLDMRKIISALEIHEKKMNNVF